jgi:acyl-CoA thioester hydrolase
MVKTDVRVIYADTDQMGFVYHAHYLRYCEAGRNEYLRARGTPYREIERDLGLVLPVVEAHLDYKKPARYDDLLGVETTIGKLGRASVRFDYRVVRYALAESSLLAGAVAGGFGNPPRVPERMDQTLLCSGHTVHACLDRAGKIQKLPEALIARLTSC